MANSRAHFILIFLFLVFSPFAIAQQPAQGFALERFYPSAPGGGWFVMDTLDMHGDLGGDFALTVGYSHDPLVVHGLKVISTNAFEDVGLAVNFDRFRFYLNLPSPIEISGNSGTVGNYSFTAPSIDWGMQPDTLSDMRIGFDTRLVGDADSSFRLGAGAQIFIPNGTTPYGSRSDYNSDGNYRAMLRLLVAGDSDNFSYAGQAGVHIRSINEPQVPGNPQGSEFLFGLAGGRKIQLGSGASQIVVGFETYGASALRSPLHPNETALEGLLSARFEETAEKERQLRVKFGVGAGIAPNFGAPEWRAILSFEIFNRNIFGSGKDSQK